MGYPDWIIRASEAAGVATLIALVFAIFYVADLLHRFQRTGRSGAILATLALGLAGAIGAAIGITLLVGEVHSDHQSNGAAIGWSMMIGYPALFLAGPVALIAWSAALVSGAKPKGEAPSPGSSQSAPAQRQGRFQDRS
jgi:MFS family permease